MQETCKAKLDHPKLNYLQEGQFLPSYYQYLLRTRGRSKQALIDVLDQDICQTMELIIIHWRLKHRFDEDGFLAAWLTEHPTFIGKVLNGKWPDWLPKPPTGPC